MDCTRLHEIARICTGLHEGAHRAIPCSSRAISCNLVQFRAITVQFRAITYNSVQFRASPKSTRAIYVQFTCNLVQLRAIPCKPEIDTCNSRAISCNSVQVSCNPCKPKIACPKPNYLNVGHSIHNKRNYVLIYLYKSIYMHK